MRNLIVALALASGVFLGSDMMIGAAPNPARTGQPGAECGEEGAEVMPAGFETPGFAHAEEVYAGSEDSASLAHSQSEHAVSQYDIACYQLTSSGH